MTVGTSMALVILVASLMGTLIPAVFQRLGIDPAVSCGPFVTIANDISGIVIYLSLSFVFMKYIAG
jgi:magnesium transporter